MSTALPALVIGVALLAFIAGFVIAVYRYTPKWESAEVVENAKAPNTFVYRMQRYMGIDKGRDPRYKAGTSVTVKRTQVESNDVVKPVVSTDEMKSDGHPDLQTSSDVRAPYASSIVGDDGRIRLPGSARADAISNY